MAKRVSPLLVGGLLVGGLVAVWYFFLRGNNQVSSGQSAESLLGQQMKIPGSSVTTDSWTGADTGAAQGAGSALVDIVSNIV